MTVPARLASPALRWSLLLSVVGANGCAHARELPPGPAPPTLVEAPTPDPAPVASTAPTEAEALIQPGELRCGLDDGPVPVGRNDELPLRSPSAIELGDISHGFDVADRAALGIRIVAPSRPPPPVEAAPPWAAATWAFGDELIATPSFVRRARSCAASPADVGEHAFAVRLRKSGRPLSVGSRSLGHAPSALLACFAAALCETSRAEASLGEGSNATLKVSLMPPVFTGTVRFTTGEDSAGALRRDGSPTGKRVPRRGPFTAAEHRWHDGLGAMLERGTLACAQRTPPAEFVSMEVRLPYDRSKRRFSNELAGKTAGNAFERQLQRCFADAAVAALLPPPDGLVPNGAVTLFVDITPVAPGSGALPDR